MLSDKNTVVVASAGSGKTTYLVKAAIDAYQEKVLILTYTNENLRQIKDYLIMKCGYVPPHITIQSWFSFLLQDGVRPYQSVMNNRKRVKSIFYYENILTAEQRDRLRYIPEDLDNHYFTNDNIIYVSKVSKFACRCNEKSGNEIITRLEHIYSFILIDEAQDLEGWDYDLVGYLLNSSIKILLIGDPRQKILDTYHDKKNNQYKTIFKWINDKFKGKFFLIEK
jgi:DNA helicase II / ATP-dependent DNA helicase PcrA